MLILANLAVASVAVAHVGFMILEMLFWTSPVARGLSGMDLETSKASSALAANQGLYNLFLAAGLAWGLSSPDNGWTIKLFFLGCVIIAGVFGGLTVKGVIFFAQAVPAAIALLLVAVAR